MPGFSGVGFWLAPLLPEPCFGELFCGVVADVDVVEDDEPDPEDGFGLRVVEVEVVVEGEVGVEVVGAGVVAVTVAAGVVAVAGGHDQDGAPTICAPGGSGSEDTGVPDGTFWNVNVWPPRIVITTVQPSADASGSAARPSTVTMDAMVTAAMVSVRLLNTVAYSSRGMPRANLSQLRSKSGLIRTLLASAGLCNWEPSVWWMSVRVPAP